MAFLRARYDEIERTASYAGPARIAWLTYLNPEGQMLYTTVAASDTGAQDLWVADGKVLPAPDSVRIVYDPASVLLDVEADRKILVLLENPVVDGRERDWDATEALGQVVKIRAERFSDHPGYRQEWRP